MDEEIVTLMLRLWPDCCLAVWVAEEWVVWEEVSVDLEEEDLAVVAPGEVGEHVWKKDCESSR